MKLVKILHRKMRSADSGHRYQSLPSAKSDESRMSKNRPPWWSPERSSDNTSATLHESTTYLDGMRGLAAFVVYIEHFSLPYQNGMLIAYGSPGATSYWQLPIIRLLYSGTPMVSIFFAVSGCALSLKVLKLARSRDHSAAFNALSSSTFRRAIRLFAPTSVATFLVMLLTQLRLYEHPYPILEIHGRRHMVLDRPPRLASFWLQLIDWVRYLIARLYYPETWMGTLLGSTSSIYASQLWTIPVEFYASMVLYVGLLGLINTRPWIRQTLLALLATFDLAICRWDLMLFFAGALVAEGIVAKDEERRHGDTIFQGYQTLDAVQSCALSMTLLLALILLSYPDHEARTNPLYLFLAAIADNHRQWQSLGAALLLFTSPRLHLVRRLFGSAPICFLGRISYGLYIVHIPVLASYGWAIVPLLWDHITGNDTWWRRSLGFSLGLIMLTPLVLLVATLWTDYVDQPCQNLARWLELSYRSALVSIT